MSDLPRIGIVGLGSIGRAHIRTWKKLDCPIVAVADVSTESLAAQKQELGAEGFANANELLAGAEIDILSICTPPAFHKDIAIAAAEAGVHILCEKPLASNLADAEAIAAAVERTEATLHVGFCHRFEGAIVEMRNLIANGEIGNLISIHNRFAGHMVNAHETWFSNPAIAGGGALADTAIHSIDMFRFLTGLQPVTQIRSLNATQETNLGPALEVEDSGTILLQNDSGVMGVLEASWRTPPGAWTVTAYGTGGKLHYDYVTHVLRAEPVGKDPGETSLEGQDRFADEFSNVVSTWRGESEPEATVADGVEANRILAAAYADAAR